MARWKQTALEYHHGRGERTLTVETPPEDLKRLRRLLELNVSLERAYREISTLKGRAAASTVEALMFGLRDGTKALTSPAVRRRLSELSEAQVREVGCAPCNDSSRKSPKRGTRMEL